MSELVTVISVSATGTVEEYNTPSTALHNSIAFLAKVDCRIQHEYLYEWRAL